MGYRITLSFPNPQSEEAQSEDYLDQVVFAGNQGTSVDPIAEDVAGFEKYTENYKRCLPVEQSAVDHKL